jgi:hypothetical protein
VLEIRGVTDPEMTRAAELFKDNSLSPGSHCLES